MKFFKPEDFSRIYLDQVQAHAACLYANNKLERKGTVVYSHLRNEHIWAEKGYANDTVHKALLINIEPIKKCTHPYIKIKGKYSFHHYEWQCECGAKVQPKEFEEVK